MVNYTLSRKNKTTSLKMLRTGIYLISRMRYVVIMRVMLGLGLLFVLSEWSKRAVVLQLCVGTNNMDYDYCLCCQNGVRER